LNEPKPKISVPVLTPKRVKKMEREKQYAADKMATAKKYAKYKLNKFVNWLPEYVPPKPKIIDTAFEYVKKSIIDLFPKTEEEPFTVKKPSLLKTSLPYNTP